MKIVYLIPLFLLFAQAGEAQEPQNLEEFIELAQILRKYKPMQEPKGLQKAINRIESPDLAYTKRFIDISLSNRKPLLEKDMLMMQDSQTLHTIYSVLELAKYLDPSDSTKNKAIAKQICARPTRETDLLHGYYNYLFISVIHPYEDYGIRKQRFFFDDLDLATATERSTFFLVGMSKYFSLIYKQIYIQSPPDPIAALSWIVDFPTYENKPYYYYKDFDFPDFKVKIDNRYQSFKSYYLNQYYELLLSHLYVLRETKGKEKQAKDLLENSILSDPSLYKYADVQRQDILKTLGGKHTFSILENEEQSQNSPQNQALSAFKNEDFEEAVIHLLVAIEMEGSDPNLYKNLGYSYLKLKDYEKSVAAYKELSLLIPASPDGYYGMALAQKEQKDFSNALKNARKAYSRAEELTPTEAYKAQGLMGLLYFDLGDTKNAKSVLKKAHKLGFQIPTNYMETLGLK